MELIPRGYAKEITLTGTRQRIIENSRKAVSVTVTANTANTGYVYWGGPDVSSTTGIPLKAGDSVTLSATNRDEIIEMKDIWLDVSVSEEDAIVTWIERRED